jgi:hypothetical protein
MKRFHYLAVAVVGFIALAMPALAQQKGRPWTQTKTAWGDPDLQGTWTNETITPFERPAALGEKAFLTEAEAAQIETSAARQRSQADAPAKPGDVGSYNQFWFDSGTKVVSTRQTSLVVDPPDGRVPVKPETMQLREEYDKKLGDAPEFMSPWDRCITRGIPGGFFPAGYNNAYQIVQTRGYVTIHYEMIHEARVIPIDGRPHLPPSVRSWNGDPRGRWDGNTLIVETTNFNNKGWIATSAATGRIKGIPQTESLRLVERFTPVDADTILYEAIVDDPAMYTRTWTVSMPLERNPGYRVYEYACHEGNRAVEGVLRGARADERQK